MPTYQYACTACGHRLEAIQSFTDAALTECPECEGRLRKLFSAVGIVFKGSGFYRTDSRSGSGANGSADKSGADTLGTDKSGADKSAADKSAGATSEKSGRKTSGGLQGMCHLPF